MIHMKTPLICCALLSAALLHAAPPSAPVGPGGVIDSVESFIEAMDTGDTAFLELALAREIPGRAYGFDEQGSLKEDGTGKVPLFYDVGMGGTALRAATPAEFASQVTKRVSAKGKGGQRLETKIRSIRADCPSANCSYAVVEFDRIYGKAGENQLVIPMRASVLLKYNGGTPHFKIFHWHASRTVAE